MEVFFTADLHLDHDSIIRHASRGYANVDEMNEKIVEDFNSLVPKKNSLTYIIGDFAWKNHNKWISRLNGKKILVKGNHDKASLDVYKNFTEVYEGSRIISINGKRMFLSHYCHRVWYCSHYGCPHLFGHSHGRLKTLNISFDVGIDTDLAQKRFPLTFEQISIEVNRRIDEMDKAGRIIDEGRKTLYRQDDFSYIFGNNSGDHHEQEFELIDGFVRRNNPKLNE